MDLSLTLHEVCFYLVDIFICIFDQGRIQDFIKKRGCFAYVLASAAKLAHAHYRQASRARSARSWPVPNPPQVVGMYVSSVPA